MDKLKKCPYCGGLPTMEEVKVDLGHGYAKYERRYTCNVCQSATKAIDLLDICYLDEIEIELVKSLLTYEWNSGKVERNSKTLDVTITRAEYERLLANQKEVD